MTNAALQMEKIKSVNQLLPPRGSEVYPAGFEDNDKGYVKYGPPSSDQPTLLIENPLSDNDGNQIYPGFYELALSYDRVNLLLTQSQKVVAIIPVFKIEEDKSQEEIQPMDNKTQRKVDKQKKKEDKKNKKLKEQGKIVDVPQVYNNATIDYQADGDYYLIKYERGKIRAWGAIKL